MRITIKERATFLTRTTDWQRLEDAMRAAEAVLKPHNATQPSSPLNQKGQNND